MHSPIGKTSAPPVWQLGHAGMPPEVQLALHNVTSREVCDPTQIWRPCVSVNRLKRVHSKLQTRRRRSREMRCSITFKLTLTSTPSHADVALNAS